MSQRKIAVIAAHPDDEVLGCGATMAKHHSMGDDVSVLILGEGLTSRGNVSKKELSQLQASAIQANEVLGVKTVEFGGFLDNRMDGVELLDIVNRVEAFIASVQPDRIYTHFSGDLNVDHALTSRAVITATRPLLGSAVKQTLFFEVLSSTEWNFNGAQDNGFFPNWFEPVDRRCIGKKLAALKCYAQEMRGWPHPRSYQAVEALAAVRGCTVGCDVAEAFMVGRVVA